MLSKGNTYAARVGMCLGDKSMNTNDFPEFQGSCVTCGSIFEGEPDSLMFWPFH